ncbi:MAG TPA: pilus assembly protein CpaE [Actinomycetales bacterium]|nr:pilus assembly protein CpaE [Actinomycetales bacterium]
MINRELAERLRDSGIPWDPRPGDRFAIPDRGLDDSVFVISDMTIETQDVPGGRVIKFNGTTEWALDWISADDVLWLPREDQLRGLLGERFARLEALPEGFAVETADGERHVDLSPERAYARAVLAIP